MTYAEMERELTDIMAELRWRAADCGLVDSCFEERLSAIRDSLCDLHCTEHDN